MRSSLSSAVLTVSVGYDMWPWPYPCRGSRNLRQRIDQPTCAPTPVTHTALGLCASEDDDWSIGFFFVRPDGQPWHPQTVSDRFDYFVTASGLPPVRLHDLRRHVSTARRADMKEIQEVLGHSMIRLTSDTYTSVIRELRRPNADAAANLIPRKARMRASCRSSSHSCSRCLCED